MDKPAIPPLPPGCNSWVCHSPTGATAELYGRANVQRLAALGWTVETSAAYLCRINAEIKKGAQP